MYSRRLYEEAAGSVWGHKVKLEQVRLWLDRGDKDGFKRVMRWLSQNEFTLYRPEMLLLAAPLLGKTSSPTLVQHATLLLLTPTWTQFCPTPL